LATRTKAPPVDRAALLRRALLELVAERGFRGTSMAAVAEQAGVATGTAYVHYDSKDELVMATYLEIKADLSAAAVTALDAAVSPREQFRHVWHNVYRHLEADPPRARYLLQVESSPYSQRAHELAMRRDDPLVEASATMAQHTVDLPPLVVWGLGFGPAVRLSADPQTVLDEAQLERLAEACWRAVSKPD
jgi:TetR/AcrR family transcriptional repressor of multidrug resistance operon